jgi:hypothetical protein
MDSSVVRVKALRYFMKGQERLSGTRRFGAFPPSSADTDTIALRFEKPESIPLRLVRHASLIRLFTDLAAANLDVAVALTVRIH